MVNACGKSFPVIITTLCHREEYNVSVSFPWCLASYKVIINFHLTSLLMYVSPSIEIIQTKSSKIMQAQVFLGRSRFVGSAGTPFSAAMNFEKSLLKNKLSCSLYINRFVGTCRYLSGVHAIPGHKTPLSQGHNFATVAEVGAFFICLIDVEVRTGEDHIAVPACCAWC